MNQALKKTILTDRLVGALGTADQIMRHAEGVLPEREFTELQLRAAALTGLKDFAVAARITLEHYRADTRDFKVQELPHTDAVLTSEQRNSWLEIQRSCETHGITIPLVNFQRTCEIVEKHVLVGGKLVDVIPVALIRAKFSDPQGRCGEIVLHRRIDL